MIFESRPKDALVTLVMTVEIVETVETVVTVLNEGFPNCPLSLYIQNFRILEAFKHLKVFYGGVWLSVALLDH